ncbi:MAG: hypothetical protein KatS3mg114_0645 [Planctomycetaceae bacterium]|nr:MAG: hypothetical protein KatS3mg114_0645 [Planctomycetaceae bacterium]
MITPSLVQLALIICWGEVGDPTLETEHPVYPGEGALQTIEQCVARATQGMQTPQEQALALYTWFLTHQYHQASPQEWNVPGKIPDTTQDDSEMVVYDAQRARFSYGYGLCGTVHAWNEPYWRALGFSARRRAFPGHTNSEVHYAGSWHALDTDMAGLLFRSDGQVAGYDDVVRDPECIRRVRPPWPHYPFAWPSDFETMQRGWQQIARGGHWYALYHGGYAAHPGIVHLRRGETFTRYFDPDAFGGPEQRRYWHGQPGGPVRDWTFVNADRPYHDGPRSNSRQLVRYGNALFDYQPLQDATSWQEGVRAAENCRFQATSPRLCSASAAASEVVFVHFSPYVICGRPMQGGNPMGGSARDGLIVEGTAVGQVEIAVSVDQGGTWQEAGMVTGSWQRDFTDQVKGRYGWWVRFRWLPGAGLDHLRFRTTTQMAQTIYPRLKPHGCRVVYRAASRCVYPVLPDFGQSEALATRHEVKPLRSASMEYVGRTAEQRLAYRLRGPQPGQIVFRVSPAQPLLAVAAAARFALRVPPPPDCDFHLEASHDAGAHWHTFASAPIPPDNEFSSGWIYGQVAFPQPVNEAWVKIHLYAGATPTGLITAELYGICLTAHPSAVRLTWGWREQGERKTFTADLPPGTEHWETTIPTGQHVQDDFVALHVP